MKGGTEIFCLGGATPFHSKEAHLQAFLHLSGGFNQTQTAETTILEVSMQRGTQLTP